MHSIESPLCNNFSVLFTTVPSPPDTRFAVFKVVSEEKADTIIMLAQETILSLTFQQPLTLSWMNTSITNIDQIKDTDERSLL